MIIFLKIYYRANSFNDILDEFHLLIMQIGQLNKTNSLHKRKLEGISYSISFDSLSRYLAHSFNCTFVLQLQKKFTHRKFGLRENKFVRAGQVPRRLTLTSHLSLFLTS